jgi:hypothetical protein
MPLENRPDHQLEHRPPAEFGIVMAAYTLFPWKMWASRNTNKENTIYVHEKACL